MSMSSWVFVEIYNDKTGEWEYAHPYVKSKKIGEFKRAEIDYGSNHEMFSERYHAETTMQEINWGIPKDVSKELKAEEEVIGDADDSCRYCWFTLSELYIETLTHPTVVDDSYIDGETVRVPNPLCRLYEDTYHLAKLYIENNEDTMYQDTIRSKLRVIVCTSY